MSNQLQKTGTPLNTITLVDTIKIALDDLKINDCHDKELAATLLGVYFIVGLREQHYPTEIEDKMLFGYIRKNYGHKTLSEIRLAFELAIKGELDLKPEDVKVYDRFSIAYFTQIMEAYRKFLLKVKSEQPEPKFEQKELPTIPMTDEDYLDMAVSVFQTNWRLIPIRAYTTLTKTKKLEISPEKRASIKRHVLALLAKEEREDDKLYEIYPKEELIQRYCKQLAVKEYLENII